MSNESSTRPKALFVLSSTTVLPLAKPAGHPGISTGFFLVEMAQILAEFEDEYDFVFATPDGKVPQLDINGLTLAFHAAAQIGSMTAKTSLEQARKSFDADAYRVGHAALVARRDAELALAYRHLGGLPVSEILPNTEKEVRLIRDDVIAKFDATPEHEYASIQQLVQRDRDPADSFSLGDFAFVHMPGGHAPMVDFNDNPWMGELLNSLHDHEVLISLICHAPVAMTSAKYRVTPDGDIVTNENHAFKGVTLTTVPKRGEKVALTMAYPKIPGQKTRLPYYVDVALEQAGYDVETKLNPAAPLVIWDEKVRLLTGNGPQAIDEQAATLRKIIAAG